MARLFAKLGLAGLLLAFTASALAQVHVRGYYRKNGQPTSEPKNIRLALAPARRLYGRTPAKDFGPIALKVARQSMVDADLCRNESNKRTGRIVRMPGGEYVEVH